MSAVAYLVVANPSAKNNLGTLIRCAAAFAVEEVIVVGASKWSTHGAHGSNKVRRCCNALPICLFVVHCPNPNPNSAGLHYVRLRICVLFSLDR